nr:hypothetical protein [Tanacetum cinerariifolium]
APLKPSILTRSHTSTRHKGKEIAKPITPPSKTASEEDNDPEQAQRDKDMQKNLALIAKYFKKIYKPTNNNLRTSSNSRNKNVDTTPREKVGSPVVQQSGIQCFNCKEFGHFAKECRKPKRVKDSAYHKEKICCANKLNKHITATWKRSRRFLQLTQALILSQWNSNTCLVETYDSNVILDSPDMCEDAIHNDQNDLESDDECVALANLKLDVDENKKIQKQLKKANTTLAQELKECKTILAETIDYKLNYLEHSIPVAPVLAYAGNKFLSKLLQLTLDRSKDRRKLLELKILFSQQVEHKLLQIVREFHACKQEEGQSVSSYVLKMKSYIDNLERLGQLMSLNLAVSLIMVSLRKEYDSFMRNYNMHGMGKMVNKLHAMLKPHEKILPKKDAPAPHAIRACKVQKKNNKNKKSPLEAKLSSISIRVVKEQEAISRS